MNAKATHLTVILAITFMLQSSVADSEYANCPNPPFLFIDTKCKVTRTDCTEIVCQKDILSTSLEITAKVKKCYDPIAIDVGIVTSSYEWFEKFTSSKELSRDIPHSGDPNTKLRLRVLLGNTTRRIGLKLALATGFIEQSGRFNTTSSNTLVDGDVKRSLNDCAPTIQQGQDTLSGGEIAGIILGSIIGFVLLCYLCFWLHSCSSYGRNYGPDSAVV